METQTVPTHSEMNRPVELLLFCALLFALVLIGCEGAPGGGGDQAGADAASSDLGEIVTIFGEPLPADASLREVLEHPDAFERAQRIAQILQRSAPEDLETLRIEFENASLNQGDIEYSLFAHWWARFDPEAAFVYCDNHLRFEFPRVLLDVVRAWGRKDPIGAVESSLLARRGTTSPAMADELVDALVVGWFESGEPGLGEWIVQQPDSGNIARGLRAYAKMRVLKYGDVETLEWIIESPEFEPQLRRLLLAGALTVIAHQNPALAVEWMETAEERGVEIYTFMPRIARSWAHHEPQKTMEWVLQYPDFPDRERAIMGITRRWLKRDEPGMVEWLKPRVGEEWTDQMRYQSIRFYAQEANYRVDWSHLMDRAAEIVEVNRRRATVLWLAQRWFVADQPAAEAWMASHPDAMTEKQFELARSIKPKERERVLEGIQGVTSKTR
jgi:hypothetical protein